MAGGAERVGRASDRHPQDRTAAASSGSKKSPAAFRTISEVSEELGVPQHVLRFWETKFSQVRPLKRGGGRRYYRPEDLALLGRIKGFLYDDGYTIRGVQKILRDNGTKAILAAEPNAGRSAAGNGVNGRTLAKPDGSWHRDELREVLTELRELRDILKNAL